MDVISPTNSPTHPKLTMSCGYLPARRFLVVGGRGYFVQYMSIHVQYIPSLVMCIIIVLVALFFSHLQLYFQMFKTTSIFYSPSFIYQCRGILKQGTTKLSTLIGFSILNHPFWDTPSLGNPPCWTTKMVQFHPHHVALDPRPKVCAACISAPPSFHSEAFCCFHKWGIPKWLVYNGKPQAKIDDLGVPCRFRFIGNIPTITN